MMNAIEIWKKPNGLYWTFSVLIVFVLLVVSWLIVYFTGGTQYSYLQLIYIPIIFASFSLGVKGGIAVATLAGILLGPFMPLDVENNISQTFHAYSFRTFFFLLIGGIVGYISMFLRLHLIKVQENLNEISLIYAETLRNYAKMVSARDEQTSYHCERVAYNALLVGHALGLDEQNCEALYWSGLLHDVGKIGVKESILLKPDKLAEEEFEEIKKHTVIGNELISSLSKDLNKVAEGIRSHHEKWNGSGYPDGLKGKGIPLFGRILSIVDVYEALTSERPYKEPWEPVDALDFILEQKGTFFDPEIVEVFEQLCHQEKIWVFNKPFNQNKKIIPTKFTKEMLNT